MSLQLFDSLIVVDAPRRTGDGYLAVEAKVARTGVQIYHGSEVGRDDMKEVRVYRSPEEVFKSDSLRTYAHRPLTNDHPREPVNNKNWKKHAVGHTGDEIVRDGDYVRVPMVLMDSGVITDYEAGKKELSLGYMCDLAWEPGEYTDNEGVTHAYDAVQKNIRANHLALVKKARGGDQLRLDGVDEDLLEQVMDKECPKCGYTMKGKECTHCGYTVDFNPNHDPRTGQFAPTFGTASEATAWLNRERNRLKKAKVIKHEEVLGEVPTGVLAWLRGGRKVKRISYEISRDGMLTVDHKLLNQLESFLKDSADVITADDLASDDNHMETNMKFTVDGVSVEVPDLSAQIIQRAMSDRDTKIADLTKAQTTDAASITTLTTQINDLKKMVETKDAEIVTAKKQIDDAAVTPAKLDALVVERTEVIGKARAFMGDKLGDVKGKTNGEIRRMCVDSYVGEGAKGWSDEAVNASFISITAKLTDAGVRQLADGFAGQPSGTASAANNVKLNDSYTRYDAWLRGEKVA